MQDMPVTKYLDTASPKLMLGLLPTARTSRRRTLIGRKRGHRTS